MQYSVDIQPKRSLSLSGNKYVVSVKVTLTPDEVAKLKRKRLYTHRWFDAPQSGAFAAISGQADIARRLLESGARVQCFSKYGSTPLHCEAYHGHVNVASHLIDYGANINAQGNDGLAPLHQAAKTGSPVLRLLLRQFANPNIRTYTYGDTPLHFAAHAGSIASVRHLIHAGADPQAVNLNGHRPADVAANKSVAEAMFPINHQKRFA